MTVCPHGIECDFVYRKTVIQGESYVVGGDYWHNEDERCTLMPSPENPIAVGDDNEMD